MTPLPVAPRSLLAVPPVQPATPPRRSACARPGCGRTAAHRHHAVARSAQRAQFGHVHDWLLIDNKLVLILVDLCGECHDQLESGWGGCKSRLRWAGGWAWYDRKKDTDDGITWTDLKTNTTWTMKGFCDGVYTAE